MFTTLGHLASVCMFDMTSNLPFYVHIVHRLSVIMLYICIQPWDKWMIRSCGCGVSLDSA